MKKSLVLAMALAMGVTASAYAANPFSDVPAGHWAYDSISNLVDAGVIEGYPDGSFGGDKLMTRYEMAQIVAKAMAKGANVDRLAAEFADELDALGVRVAALEKKADNVKIKGQARYSYRHDKFGGNHEASQALRSRIWFTGTVNDNWNYVGMLQNNQNFRNYTGEENTDFQRAYLDGRLGGLNVMAGRYDFTTLEGGNVYDTRMDGIKVEYGDKVRLQAYYGKPADGPFARSENYEKYWGGSLSTDIGNLNLFAEYDRFEDATDLKKDNGIWTVGANYSFGDLTLGGEYLHSSLDDKDFNKVYGVKPDTDGYVITGTYKGADSGVVGSYGLTARYYNLGAGTFVAHTMNGDAWNYGNEGFKGYMLGANYTVAKNMVLGVEWYDLKGKESDTDGDTLWTELVMTF